MGDSSPQLKILAHNNLIGRIIGKQGATIKKIMEDTDTKITVSSINDINSFNMERIITINATSIEAVSKAEAEVSAKLRAAFENDVQAMAVSVSLSYLQLSSSHYSILFVDSIFNRYSLSLSFIFNFYLYSISIFYLQFLSIFYLYLLS